MFWWYYCPAYAPVAGLHAPGSSETTTFTLLNSSSTVLHNSFHDDFNFQAGATRGGYLNVVDYGAIGNGMTDDTQAFTKAWGDLCSAGGGAPTLIIPAGRTFLLRPIQFQGPCRPTSVHLQGGKGFAKGIVFEHIILDHVTNPIIIDQSYFDKWHNIGNTNEALQVSDVTYSDIRGSSSSDVAITLKCSKEVGCKNIVMNGIDIFGAVRGERITTACSNANCHRSLL